MTTFLFSSGACHPNLRQQSDYQRGMTLVEILVAMLLGAFLLGGVIQIFVNTKQTYRMQEGLSRVQENGRFAMEFLTNDIRMADFWGCAGSADLESKLNPGSAYAGFGTGITGTNDDNGGNDHDANNDENTNDIWDGTDTITLRGATGAGIYLQDEPTNNASSLKISVASGLNTLDIVVLSNCVSGDIFQITDISTSSGSGSGSFDNVIHNTGSTSPGNASNNLETGPEASASGPHSNLYGKDAQIFKLNFVTYKIMAGASGQPALFKSTNGATFQELVEGIEDMQILYGTDTNNDGTPNTYLAAGTAGLDMDKVVSIRVSLLVRSIDDNITSQAIDYFYNNATTTPPDRRLHRVFTSTIAVRNRLH